MYKLIGWYTLNICSHLYMNYSSIKFINVYAIKESGYRVTMSQIFNQLISYKMMSFLLYIRVGWSLSVWRSKVR